MSGGQAALTVADFHRAEAAYWKIVASAQASILRQLQALITDNNVTPPTDQPEPPVGTKFSHDQTHKVGWYRDSTGWHCGGNDCKHCPVDWFEASEYVGTGWNRELPEELSSNPPTLATIGHPANRGYIVKTSFDRWRWVETGELVNDEDFRAGLDILHLPGGVE